MTYGATTLYCTWKNALKFVFSSTIRCRKFYTPMHLESCALRGWNPRLGSDEDPLRRSHSTPSGCNVVLYLRYKANGICEIHERPGGAAPRGRHPLGGNIKTTCIVDLTSISNWIVQTGRTVRILHMSKMNASNTNLG